MDICRQTKYQKNRSGNRSVNKNTKKIGQNIHPRQKERCDIGVDITSRDGPGPITTARNSCELPGTAGVARSCWELPGAARNCWELLGVAGSCWELLLLLLMLLGVAKSCLLVGLLLRLGLELGMGMGLGLSRGSS